MKCRFFAAVLPSNAGFVVARRRKHFACALPLLLLFCLSASAANWPGWSGQLGSSICDEKYLPTQCSKTNNVKWLVTLLERGNSTPVVWNEHVFVTQAQGDRRTVMCFQRADGKLLWQSGVTTKEKEPTHGTNPYCSASPV